MFRHLLVVVDGRPESFRAVLVGMRLAWCLGARVTILFIVLKRPVPGAPAPGASRIGVGNARTLFQRARRVAKALGVEHAFRFAFGSDESVLIAATVDSQACDLVIVRSGSRLEDEPRLRRPLAADLLLCR
ncbi:Universal stress protein family protein [Luteibacter sp. UNC138MFCol5.1]|nr:Universal stress protein family protein [Luteibacter sp. UNC138MFCol5.1]